MSVEPPLSAHLKRRPDGCRRGLGDADVFRDLTAGRPCRGRKASLVGEELNEVPRGIDQRESVRRTVLETREVEGQRACASLLIGDHARKPDAGIGRAGRAVITVNGPAFERATRGSGDLDELARIHTDVLVVELVYPDLTRHRRLADLLGFDAGERGLARRRCSNASTRVADFDPVAEHPVIAIGVDEAWLRSEENVRPLGVIHEGIPIPLIGKDDVVAELLERIRWILRMPLEERRQHPHVGNGLVHTRIRRGDQGFIVREDEVRLVHPRDRMLPPLVANVGVEQRARDVSTPPRPDLPTPQQSPHAAGPRSPVVVSRIDVRSSALSIIEHRRVERAIDGA